MIILSMVCFPKTATIPPSDKVVRTARRRLRFL